MTNFQDIHCVCYENGFICDFSAMFYDKKTSVVQYHRYGHAWVAIVTIDILIIALKASDASTVRVIGLDRVPNCLW